MATSTTDDVITAATIAARLGWKAPLMRRLGWDRLQDTTVGDLLDTLIQFAEADEEREADYQRHKAEYMQSRQTYERLTKELEKCHT